MNNEHVSMREWIGTLPKRGRFSFSHQELAATFPEKSPAAIKGTLARMSASNTIQSVWRGYYAIVLPDYGLRGIIPPSEYIGQLMAYVGVDYYVALLSASLIHGAAHQMPQTFQFMSNKVMHAKRMHGIHLEPVFKKHFPANYLMEKNAKSGMIKVSSPELTALDLMIYQDRAGGISNCATVIGELAEWINFEAVGTDIFDGIPVSAVQRLGFILGSVLGEKDSAGALRQKANDAGLEFYRVPLMPRQGAYERNQNVDTIWKIVLNYDVEADL
ncbi:MAG: type IV toxin-antitoxin system AbiEi family antitoxin [Coriobacteriales bacterium]|jgi:predicted transcriptional regulator of viral defense system|nr:type IV toxin-antitoxin system AbiEi family antitoxin [Coriobacteriales bacterium]